MANSNNRNRDSVADLEAELYDLFTTHHQSQENDNGEPAVPASALVDVIRIFGEHHDGMRLLTDEEEEKLDELVAANPGLEVTPSILLGFLRALTANSNASASSSNLISSTSDEGSSDEEIVLVDTGDASPDSEDDPDGLKSSGPSSRSSSRGPPPIPPKPGRVPDSPFDSNRRQRTAPLRTTAAPSSWNSKRPVPSGRRRSDAGNYGHNTSDTEQTPSRPGSRASRSRGPSTPASPRGSQSEIWAPSAPIRPPSRARSNNRKHSLSASVDGIMSPNERSRIEYDLEGLFDRKSRRNAASASDSEDDEVDDPTMSIMLDQNRAALEREELLRRTNEDLQRRVAEQDRILQIKITEHEAELERLEILLEETKSELSLSKREEKELRAKETKYIHQIQALESEIAKTQRALDIAKNSYQSLQKQYQEQCTEAESLRNALRTRDEQYRDSIEKISLHGDEIDKWQLQQEQLEKDIQSLEAQLTMAREAQAQLDEQKQENMLLKETIDRMRFDMDELRAKAQPEKMSATQRDSLSKTFGSELARMKGKWPSGDESEDEDETVVSDSGSGTENEDVVQTIITRRTKKRHGKSAKALDTIQFEDVKSYSDAYTQYEASGFLESRTTQTDPEPKKAVFTSGAQTMQIQVDSSSVQTDPIPPPLPVAKVEMDIQTELPFEDPNESVASTSTANRSGRDLPPSYTESGKDLKRETQEQHDMHIASEAIRKWHRGMDVPLSPMPNGISEDALEEWAALKEEMGFECLAIEKVLEMSSRTGRSRSERSTATSESSSGGRRKSRFYNIYNTFVYGKDGGSAEAERPLAAAVTQSAMFLGVCVVAAGVLVGPYMHHQYTIPGGPTYYDRAAWSEFNTMYPVGEGFVQDGAAGVWSFIGRVGGGAARMARGWPT